MPSFRELTTGMLPPDSHGFLWPPKNASPVPHLTSLYHFDSTCPEYGNRSYPGNCGGNLIKDLMLFFRPANVFDPMSGSGTCGDVCTDLGIDHWSNDLGEGFDLCDASLFFGDARLFDRRSFDFVWLHPPYWRQKLYSDDSRCLSRAATLDEFLERFTLAFAHSAHVLDTRGKLAILIGDYIDRRAGFIPLTYWTKRIVFESGLKQYCTDIIRFSHGTSSSRKVYQTSFIPQLHDVCMIFEKQ